MNAETESISLPITQVTCLEDRAQVERRGELTLGAGTQRVRVANISPLAVDRSLKVELSGATLIDARIVRTWKEKPRGGLPADASALRRRVRDLEEDQARIALQVSRQAARLEIIRAGRADVARAIAEAAGSGDLDRQHASEQLESLRAAEWKVEEEQRAGASDQRQVSTELQQARSALSAAEQPPPELATHIELSIASSAQMQTAIAISYLVPCGLWRPAYRAALSSGPEPVVRMEVDAVIWQTSGEDWKDVQFLLSTARPTLGASPPILVEDRLSVRAKTDQEKRTVDVTVREQAVQTAGEGSARAAAEMPGLDDGGEVRVWSAPAKATVPSDGQPHRVSLFAFESSAETERVCAAELSPLVSLVARFENRAPHVLLAGPVDLVRDSGFVGRGQQKFAARGEKVKLSFGSEDSLRVARTESSVLDESRITGRRTTTHAVKLFISNSGGEAARIALEERILVSEVKEVEVTFLAKQAKPSPIHVTAEGIVRFDVLVPPKQQQEVAYAYEVSTAGKVTGL